MLFLGGSTDWKLGPAARALTAEAKRRGKRVHMGRVNSLKRLRYADAIGCDSADGTCLTYAPDANLPRLLAWLRDVNDQAPLWERSMTGRVVLSYGMGADSTALLLRWIHEPHTRPCDLGSLLVITAMTGDEWPATGRLVTEHILPRLREHGIRWVQVARAGAAQADGITILDDSRAPRRGAPRRRLEAIR